ncbi:MAG: hypothetical protein R3C01_06400 [Planctomycetaceae bacterium]
MPKGMRDRSRQPMCRCWRKSLSLALMLMSTCFGNGTAQGESIRSTATDRYFEGLLDRGLIDVAEGEAHRRLDDMFLRPRQRTEWRIRLAEAYSRHAEYLNGEERQAFWNRATQTLTQLLEEPGVVGQELGLWQGAKIRARQAEVLRWEGSLRSDDRRFRQRSSAQVLVIIAEIRETITALESAIPGAERRSRAQTADGELSSPEMRELKTRVEALLAFALVDLVELSEPSLERSEAMHEAESRLKNFTSGWSGDPLTWESRLHRIRLQRIIGDVEQARTLIRSALAEQPVPDWQDRFVAEQVRLELAANTPDVALQLLLDISRRRGQLNDELRTLQVEALLAAIPIAQAKEDQSLSEDLHKQANQVASQTLGPWGDRSRLLLSQAEENQRYGSELAKQMRSARATYFDGGGLEAVGLYQQAAERAVALNRSDVADEFSFTAASILLEQKEYRQAVEELTRMIERSPSGLRAADADLLRAYGLGQLYEQEPTRTRREEYAAALDRHRTQHSSSPTAGEATWLLALHEESRNQWTRALTLYSEIASDHPRWWGASIRIAVLYSQILDRLRELGQPVDAWEDRAVSDLSARFEQPAPVTSDAEAARSRCEVGVHLARLWVRHRERRYPEADRVLADVFERYQQHLAAHPVKTIVPSTGTNTTTSTSTTTAEDPWMTLVHVASQLRIVSLAGQGKLEEAGQVLDGLATTSPRAMLSILLGLGEMADGIAVEQQQGLGRLQLQAARRVETQRDALAPEELRRLDESLAEASVAAGEATEGIRRYRKLLIEHPGDLRLTRTLAALLQVQPQREAVTESQRLWQKLMEKQTKGSREWLTSRYELADCAVRLGQTEEARKLLGLTRVIYPELGGPDLKARYEALEKSLPTAGKPPGGGGKSGLSIPHRNAPGEPL